MMLVLIEQQVKCVMMNKGQKMMPYLKKDIYNAKSWHLSFMKLTPRIFQPTILLYSKCSKNVSLLIVHLPSRGGLEVEHWSDNRLHSAFVGSNPV